ncbi:hypothetical protein H2200_007540 [Cladophialophora chaetospira]|uniref:Uncharacterized protein n=1 Tax=Cladophialophora chaetospira TaxID=386627 RepID=A0AA38X800_9EURO|nr:hypothetical protein H2200_007540 [Cladophialophora chaetospira]
MHPTELQQRQYGNDENKRNVRPCVDEQFGIHAPFTITEGRLGPLVHLGLDRYSLSDVLVMAAKSEDWELQAKLKPFALEYVRNARTYDSVSRLFQIDLTVLALHIGASIYENELDARPKPVRLLEVYPINRHSPSPRELTVALKLQYRDETPKIETVYMDDLQSQSRPAVSFHLDPFEGVVPGRWINWDHVQYKSPSWDDQPLIPAHLQHFSMADEFLRRIEMANRMVPA